MRAPQTIAGSLILAEGGHVVVPEPDRRDCPYARDALETIVGVVAKAPDEFRPFAFRCAAADFLRAAKSLSDERIADEYRDVATVCHRWANELTRERLEVSA